MIRKISAHYVFPVSSVPVKFGIVVCTNLGEIVEVIDNKGTFKEIESLEFFDGILVPSFIGDDTRNDRTLLEEMKQLQQNSKLTLEEILRMFTLDRATKSNTAQKLGSFDKHKSPGINLITKIDFSNMKLTAHSDVKVLVASAMNIS
jgi:predicted DNA-binding antitoxin AbrB/MazE fold protein